MNYENPTPAATTAARTLFRVGLGGVLFAHGTQKLFGWFGGGGLEGTSQGLHAMGFRPGKTSAVLAGVGEAGAGLALALGIATPAAGAAEDAAAVSRIVVLRIPLGTAFELLPCFFSALDGAFSVFTFTSLGEFVPFIAEG